MTAGSDEVDAAIAAVHGWRGEALARVRALIRAALPEASEAVKWRKPSNPAGVPVWEQDGLICTGETYKDKVKLTFAQGASLADPTGLFNAADTGKVRRSIDLREGDELDAAEFSDLVRAAAAFNAGQGKR